MTRWMKQKLKEFRNKTKEELDLMQKQREELDKSIYFHKLMLEIVDKSIKEEKSK